MRKGIFLAAVLGVATVALIVIGTLWPVETARAYAGRQALLSSSSTPEEAVRNLGEAIRQRHWAKAYASLANKDQFTEPEFQGDVTGYYPNLCSYSTLDHFDVRPLHATDDDAEVQLELDWATVVGIATDTRDLRVVRDGDRWEAEWPFTKRPTVPPQVIPVNYLRWDVIYRGP